MAQHDVPLTSETIASMLHTNAVVVRRTMAGLREAGFVKSTKGHGGGWVLCCDLAALTLFDIHSALGEPTIFAFGNAAENPQCLVEQAVNGALSSAFQDAQALLMARLREVTLADLAADFKNRFAAHCSTEAGLVQA
jgi:DNA-binding IscR family transcriptional regulator